MANTPTDRFSELRQTLSLIGNINAAAGKVQWDAETMVPTNGAEAAGETMSVLAEISHQRSTDPTLGTLLAALTEDAAAGRLSDEEAAVVRLTSLDYAKESKFPTSLVKAFAATTSNAHAVWVKARKASDFSVFAPTLTKIVDLVRQRADCLGYSVTPYDALLDEYEPGNTVATVAPRLQGIADTASDLLRRVQASPLYGKEPSVKLAGSLEFQRQFARFVGGSIGFDWMRGRLDETAHPFCGGSSSDDVRLCTHYWPDDLMNALYSTIHEAGHGIYEQGLKPEWRWTPLGSSTSMSIHEMNSRLWENNVGRSLPFVRWLHRQLVAFGALNPADLSANDLYIGLNVVRPGYIRIDADEATYGIHVYLRFEIERRLLSGELAVPDVPAAWNALIKQLLDLDVTDDALGCLQDVHWSAGLFGYFPSYALGSSNAAQAFAAMERTMGSNLNFEQIRAWLSSNIHAHGRRYDPDVLMEMATGKPPSADDYRTYLIGKYGEIYGF
jgi:carboxypeptidase Taq